MPQAKASASRLKRFAHSAIEEANAEGTYQVSAAIKKAGNMTRDNLKNAERDLHVLFGKYQLTVPVSLSALKCGLFHIHFFSMWSWFNFLMADYSQLLLGGFQWEDPLAALLLRSFWQQFAVANPDHWVFIHHPNELHRCIPFFVHLDEGTGLRKSAVLVFNLQSMWGLDTATEFRKLHSSSTERTDDAMAGFMVEAQRHNQRGSSLMSRFLYTVVPKKLYTKRNAFAYEKLLDNIATECRKLACEGVRGIFPICLGVKGDAPALAKAGHYTRSFQTLIMIGKHCSYSMLHYNTPVEWEPGCKS